MGRPGVWLQQKGVAFSWGSISRYTDAMLYAALSITAGILANLFSGLILSKTPFPQAIAELGWWNLLVVLGLVLLVMVIGRQARRDRRIRQALAKRFATVRVEIIRNMFVILARSIGCWPTGITIHIFFWNGTALVKDRAFSYEERLLPGTHHLDVVLTTDELVICKAFNQGRLIYKELPADHLEHYNERIKGKIDPNIKWVMGCPLSPAGGSKLGVICCFSQELVFADENQLQAFQDLLLRLSDDIISQITLFASELLTANLESGDSA